MDSALHSPDINGGRLATSGNNGEPQVETPALVEKATEEHLESGLPRHAENHHHTDERDKWGSRAELYI